MDTHKVCQTPPPSNAARSSALLQLPRHILGQIASHLPHQTALALACTHPGLKEAAEEALWSHLGIYFDTYDPSASPISPTTDLERLGGSKLHRINQLQAWGFTGRYADLLGEFFVELGDHLSVKEERKRAVRAITIDIDRLLHLEFTSILNLVSPTLHTLDFVSLSPPNDRRSCYIPIVRQLFECEQDLYLPRLTRLSLPLDEEWDLTIKVVLPRVPDLESLTLFPERPYSNGWTAFTTFRPSNIIGPWPTLPRLKSLKVTQIDGPLLPMLYEMITCAPDLESITWHDPGLLMDGESQRRLLQALNSCQRLRYLCVPSTCLDHLGLVGVPGLEEVSVMDDEEHLLRLPGLESLVIPQMKRMKVFRHQTILTPKPPDSFTEPHGDPCSSNRVQSIPSVVLTELKQAETLILIDLTPYGERQIEIPLLDEGWECLPDRIAQHNNSVVLVRMYHTLPDTGTAVVPAYVDEACCGKSLQDEKLEHETLVHCRVLGPSNGVLPFGDEAETKPGMVWEEYADYRGHTVPLDVLREVYKLLGESLEWRVPGRRLRLPEKAWEILRRSKETETMNDDHMRMTKRVDGES